MNTWGRHLRLSIFGESHGTAVGIVIDGLPPGLELDYEFISSEMSRRAPGGSEHTSARIEPDEIDIISGIFEGKTAGTPVCAMIRNRDARPGDYDKASMRPGHADYTGLVKYRGYGDYRGGGHFSGRLTAPLVFAGALAKLELNRHGIAVDARILSVAGAPIEMMETEIKRAKACGDSVGGVIECVINNLPAGLGDPFFFSAESVISSILFSVPAVKAVEFGDGFALTQMRGSEANDSFYMDNGRVKTRTNHNGGINGGITNGMPLVFRVAIKPTPSISIEQDTVDIDRAVNTRIISGGRHDPCIAVRVLPVIESVAAISALELWGCGQ